MLTRRYARVLETHEADEEGASALYERAVALQPENVPALRDLAHFVWRTKSDLRCFAGSDDVGLRM